MYCNVYWYVAGCVCVCAHTIWTWGTPDHYTSRDCNGIAFIYVDFNMELVPLIAAITASTFLGRISTGFWIVSVGIFAHSFCECINEVKHCCWMRKFGSQSLLQLSQRCSKGLCSGLCVSRVLPHWTLCFNGPCFPIICPDAWCVTPVAMGLTETSEFTIKWCDPILLSIKSIVGCFKMMLVQNGFGLEKAHHVSISVQDRLAECVCMTCILLFWNMVHFHNKRENHKQGYMGDDSNIE